MVRLCFENRSEAVAQIFKLPYRRVALGKAASPPQRPQPAHRLSTIRPILEQTQTRPERAEWLNSLARSFDVRRSMFDVRCCPRIHGKGLRCVTYPTHPSIRERGSSGSRISRISRFRKFLAGRRKSGSRRESALKQSRLADKFEPAHVGCYRMEGFFHTLLTVFYTFLHFSTQKNLKNKKGVALRFLNFEFLEPV